MNSFDEESLSKLSKSELKKQAKKHGVKVNMPTDKIIASLLEKSNADEDSFVTMERTILNSCKKNKEALFDRDSKKISETPRRDTYIVDTPSLNTRAVNSSIVMASASPEFKHIKDDSLNVTMSRGSEKKNRKSKRKVSFVTPLRRSTRFSTATPQYNSVKGRPKTPMPSRLSSSTKKRLSVTDEKNDSIVCNLNLDISETLETKKTSVGNVKRPSTPMPLSKQNKTKLRTFGDPHDYYKHCLNLSPKVILDRLKEEDIEKFLAGPTVTTSITQPDIKVTTEEIPYAPKNLENERTPRPQSSRSNVHTQGFKKIVTPFQSSKKTATPTPKNLKNEKTPRPQSSRSNVHTPGLKKIVTPFQSSKKTATPRSLIKSTLTPGLTSSAMKKSPRLNVKSTATPKLTSSAVKKTPNFKKLHQKAFENMESIFDYHQRKLMNSQKKKEEQKKLLNVAKSSALKQKKALLDKKLKKVPNAFSGIPFIPSAATTKPLKSVLKLKSDVKAVSSVQSKRVNERNLTKKAIAGNVKAIKSGSRENTPLKQRHKFDLRASLARKLPYKPHTGPLKPLNEINLNDTVNKAQFSQTKNVVLAKARAQTREVLHGVRKNKRFMLQMNNRNLDITTQ